MSLNESEISKFLESPSNYRKYVWMSTNEAMKDGEENEQLSLNDDLTVELFYDNNIHMFVVEVYDDRINSFNIEYPIRRFYRDELGKARAFFTVTVRNFIKNNIVKTNLITPDRGGNELKKVLDMILGKDY